MVALCFGVASTRQKTPDSFLSSPLQVRWQHQTAQTLNLSAAVGPKSLYLPLTDGVLVALATDSGQLRWKAEVGGEITAAPIADERGVYVASGNSHGSDAVSTGAAARAKAPPPAAAVHALSRESGVTLWRRALKSAPQGALLQTADALVAGAADGRVYAVRKSDGELLWDRQAANAPFASRPISVGGKLLIGNDDGHLYALDLKSGATLWRYRTRGSVRGTIAHLDDAIFFGSADGQVYAVSLATGERLWSKRTGAGVQSVSGSAEGLLIASLDNFVYLLKPGGGSLRWKRQLGGRITSPPHVGATSAVFAPLGGDAVVVLDLSNGKQLNSVALGEAEATGVSPQVSDDLLLIATSRGLIAYGNSRAPAE